MIPDQRVYFAYMCLCQDSLPMTAASDGLANSAVASHKHGTTRFVGLPVNSK